MKLVPITSEKAVRMIDADNTLLFEVERRAGKNEIKKVIADTFNVKIVAIRTHIRNNKKYAYVQFSKDNPAIDVATKLGMI